MRSIKFLAIAFLASSVVSCSMLQNDPYRGERLKPVYKSDKTNYDTDDPAIWVNPLDVSKSLIVGTDKDSRGGLFVYDLQGKLVKNVPNLKRPNNVDIAYGFNFQGEKIDIAVTTEREENQIRIYQLPSMEEIGTIPVFLGEQERAPMGISMYKNASSGEIYAVVGRKSGPSEGYLWQYLLTEKDGKVSGEVVRKFGKYSGVKEIEAIAVDNELGYIYYSDEQHGVRKYYADPAKGNEELAIFGQQDFADDMEGISIYDSGDGKGYILVSDQGANTFNVYPREGDAAIANSHTRIAIVPVSTKSSDGSEVSNVNFGPDFPSGLFVAMSEGKVFHYYDWRVIQEIIEKQK